MAIYTSNTSNYYYITLEMVVASQSVADNSTKIDFETKLHSGSSSFIQYGSKADTKINGVTLFTLAKQVGISKNSTLVLGSGSITVPHNSDGSKTVSFSAYFETNTKDAYTPAVRLQLSGSLALPTIPRASDVTSFPNFLIGDDIDWVLDRKDASFTHKIQVLVGSSVLLELSGVDDISGTFSNYTKADFLNKLTETSKQLSAILKVWTYAGSIQDSSTQVGDPKTKTATATAKDADIKPTLSSTVSEAAEGMSAFSGTWVQNKSRLKFENSASGFYGATIKTFRTTVDGVHYIGETANTGVVTRKGAVNAIVRVTDSREVTNEITIPLTIVEYYPPAITKFDANRYPSQESSDLRIQYAYDVAPVSNKNTVSMVLRFRRPGEGNTNLTTNTSDYQKDTTYNASGILSVDYSYEVEILLYDAFTNLDPISIIAEIGTGFDLMNFHASGKGMAIGKVAEKSDAFQFGIPAFDKNGDEILGGSYNHTHSADEITSGTFDKDRIPELDASKIISGVFSAEQIPNLSASKITSGTFDVNRIPLEASIEASGSASGQWWIKFADGTLIKRGYTTVTEAISTGFAGHYIGAERTVTFDTTVPFNAVPSVVSEVADNTANRRGVVPILLGQSSTHFDWQTMSVTSRTSQVWKVGWIAMGRWK